MSVENADFISELNPDWPTPTDRVSEGDDHERLIKHVLQTQFPNLFEAVTATAEQLNGGGVVTGSCTVYAGISIPAGYFLCDGQELSRTAYEKLYQAIGTAFGEGDGLTTFNLPNFVDRVAAGGTPGETAGKNTWDQNDLPQHKHAMNNDGAHAHAIKTSSFDKPSGSNRVADRDRDNTDTIATNTDGAHTHGMNNVGLEAITDNRQQTLYVHWIIKT